MSHTNRMLFVNINLEGHKRLQAQQLFTLQTFFQKTLLVQHLTSFALKKQFSADVLPLRG